MRNRVTFLVFIFFYSFTCTSTLYSPDNSMVFSHNDYAQSIPFSNAYHHRVGYIEADIYLRRDSLLVAHEIDEINTVNTLQNMYLDSLAEKIKSNHGTIYSNVNRALILMIDLKTSGELTIPILIQTLQNYPALISGNNNLKIVLSGAMPSPDTWDQYPGYIWFDGRPTIAYDAESLKRIAFVSTNFKNYSNWDGNHVISDEDDGKIISLVKQIHAMKKPVRFWSTPDNENAWAYLTKRKVDILGTDKVSALCEWLSTTN